MPFVPFKPRHYNVDGWVCVVVHIRWMCIHWYRFWLRLRPEDAECRSTLRVDTPAWLRRDEDGQSRHAVRHAGTVPFRRRRHQRLRCKPFVCSSTCHSCSTWNQLPTFRLLWSWRRVFGDANDCRWHQEEGAQAAYHLLESAAASAWSSVSEDAVLGVAWARWTGLSARTYADTGDYTFNVCVGKKLCCRREAARYFVSVCTLVSFNSKIPRVQSFVITLCSKNM